MDAIISFLERIGTNSLELLWLPILIWSVAALLVVGFMRLHEHKISAAYQYHSRVALLWGLAAGVIGTVLLNYLPAQSSGEVAAATGIFVFQSPITVTAEATTSAINWSAPTLWIGFITLLTIILAVIALVKLMVDFTTLTSFAKKLSKNHINFADRLTINNKRLLIKSNGKVNVMFSNDVDVPCTFGWLRKRIVLPTQFKDNTDKLNMALRHELTHIMNNDYLLNNSVQTIKALFFFHPLVHKLCTSIEEYREIYCDQYVLQDTQISQKGYAKLLFELSPKSVFKKSAAVNMAVHFSTLKKRIQTMQTPNPSLPSLKWSISLMVVATLMITGLMACSDIEEGGITQTEVEQTQANIDKAPADGKPLYVLDGEIMDDQNSNNIMSRLKPKYIESINVLKDEKATEAYGEQGKNGVIQIELRDKEKALEDLRTAEEMDAMANRVRKGKSDSDKVIFMAVEDEPELIGGLAELQKNVEYPESCRRANIEGRVTLEFVINKEGIVENVSVLRGIGGGCDEAAVKAVEQHAKFEPGKQRGKAVNVRYSLPIRFQLDNGNSTKESNKTGELQGNIQKSKMELRDLSFQGNQITGTVYAKKANKPLAGANIRLKSTQKGTTTNPNGEFRIANVNQDGGKVLISYVGYSDVVVELE